MKWRGRSRSAVPLWFGKHWRKCWSCEPLRLREVYSSKVRTSVAQGVVDWAIWRLIPGTWLISAYEGSPRQRSEEVPAVHPTHWRVSCSVGSVDFIPWPSRSSSVPGTIRFLTRRSCSPRLRRSDRGMGYWSRGPRCRGAGGSAEAAGGGAVEALGRRPDPSLSGKCRAARAGEGAGPAAPRYPHLESSGPRARIHTSPGQRPGFHVDDESRAEGLLHLEGWIGRQTHKEWKGPSALEDLPVQVHGAMPHAGIVTGLWPSNPKIWTGRPAVRLS